MSDDYRPELQRLSRCIYIRRYGNMFRVEVEPHPELGKGFDSHNRTRPTWRSAHGYALGTQLREGWPVIDETNRGLA